jgi:hypothetical protein
MLIVSGTRNRELSDGRCAHRAVAVASATSAVSTPIRPTSSASVLLTDPGVRASSVNNFRGGVGNVVWIRGDRRVDVKDDPVDDDVAVGEVLCKHFEA